MKYSILGFNQAKVMETDLDLTDLVLLKYIIESCGSTNMWHKLDSNGMPRVWISHTHLCSDLPILRISEGTLRNRLSSLSQRGYINTTVVANDSGRGSRTYYGITETTNHLLYDYEVQYDEQETTSRKNDTVERPCHEKMTSDNKLNGDSNSKVSNNKLLDILQPKKKESKKKGNLYSKCVDYISQYTNNVVLQTKLEEFLRLRLDIAKDEGKPFYYNMWPAIVNELDSLANDTDTAIKVVEQSIHKGWKNFYPLKEYNNKSRVKADATERNVDTVKKSEDELDLADEVY